ncbi:unnamed protein product [Owenia fusiformis]|uniref:Uncharacterized protein n=1 Tax=Owenia fusiformis TaxID=6347 RepID=A0A8J1UY33_OWEFU|nr:unnamed protein product [Owenia fusiformis]
MASLVFDGLPTLNEILALPRQPFTETIKITDTCSARIVFEGCFVFVNPIPENCLGVDMIIKQVFGNFNGLDSALQIGSIGESPTPLSSLTLNQVVVDVCQENISLSASDLTDDVITIIPSFLSVTDLTIDASIIVPTEAISVSFNAVWSIAGVTFNVAATVANANQYEIVATPTTQTVSMDTLLGGLSEALVPGDSSSVANLFDDLNLDRIVISNPQLIVKSPNSSSIGIQFTFTSDVSGLGTLDIMLNFNRVKGDEGDFENTLSMTVLFKDIRLSAVVLHLLSLDISKVPVIGSLHFPEMAVIVASDNVTSPIVSYNSESEVLALLPSIYKGITLLFTASVGDAFSSNFMVRLAPPNKTIHFEVLPGSETSVKDLIYLFLGTIQVELPPNFFLVDFLDKSLSGMSYDGELNTLTIPVILPDQITIIEYVFEIENPEVEFIIGLGTPKTLSFDVRGRWVIKDYPVDLSISKPPGANEFIATACPEKPIEVGIIMAKLAGQFLPNGLEDKLRSIGLTTFSIEEPCFEVITGSNFGARVWGNAVIGSWDNTKVEVLGVQASGAILMALGVVLERAKLSDVVDKLSGNTVNFVGHRIFDDSIIGFITSTHDIPNIGSGERKFTKLPMLSDTTIMKGISLMAQLKIPENCYSDKFCGVLKKFFGSGFAAVLKGRLAINFLQLEVTVPSEIELIEGFTLSDVGFRVKARAPTFEIGLMATLEVENPPLVFIGSIGVSTTGGVVAELAVAGCLKNTFLLSIVRLCDLHIRLGVTPEPTLISELGVGANAEIGVFNNPKARPFRAIVYIGLYKYAPTQNYFLGSISSLTIPDILAAFGSFPSLPKALDEIGYPEGLNMSYAIQSRTLPNGVVIPSGLRFRGILQILALKVSTVMRIDINGIFISVVVNRLEIGRGLITVEGTGGKSGPELFVDVGWNRPRAKIDINGRVCVLKICASINITIDARGIHFEIDGNILGLFEAHLRLTGSYSTLASSEFMVDGQFKQTFLDFLKNKVTDALSKISGLSTKAVEEAQEVVDKLDEKVEEAANKLRSKTDEVDRIQNLLDDKAEKIGDQKQKVNDLERKYQAALQSWREKVAAFTAQKEKLSKTRGKIRDIEDNCPSGCKRRKRRGIGFSDIKLKKEDAAETPQDTKSKREDPGATDNSLLAKVKIGKAESNCFLRSSSSRIISAIVANGLKHQPVKKAIDVPLRRKRFLGRVGRWVSRAAENTREAARRAANAAERTREAALRAAAIARERTREAAVRVERTREATSRIARERAREVAYRAEKGREATARVVRERAREIRERTREAAEKVRLERIREVAAERGREAANAARERVRETTEKLRLDKIKERAREVAEKLRLDNIKERAREIAEKARLDKIKERAREVTEKLRLERVREGAENVREIGVCKAKDAARLLCIAPLAGLRLTLKGLEGTISGLQKAVDVALKIAQDNNILFEAARKTLDGLEKSMKVLSDSLDGAKVAMNAAAELVEQSTIAFDAADKVLQGIKKTHEFGLNVASKIAKVGLGGLINIKGLRFKVNLPEANSGEFEGTMVASFVVGPDQSFSFSVRLFSINQMVDVLVEKVKEFIKI